MKILTPLIITILYISFSSPAFAAAKTSTAKLTELYNKAMQASFECGLSSDRCQDSINAFKKVMELDPGNADVYFESGWSYFCWEKYREAIDMYTKALTKNVKKRDYVVTSSRGDKNENVYDKRGLSYFYLGNNQAAIKDYSNAIKLRSTFCKDSVQSHINRGKAYSELFDHQKAISDYDQAVMIASNEGIYRQGEQTWWNDEQKIYFKNNAIMRQKTDLCQSYQARGRTYGILGNVKQAIDDYSKAIELFPDAPLNANTYYLRSISYRVMKNYEQSLNDINKAIDLAPKEPVYYYSRGETCHLISTFIALQSVSAGKTNDNTAKQLQQALYDQAFQDYKIAARLGYKEAQDYLNKAGVQW